MEFQNENMATTALGIFNGMDVLGRKLNIGRPAGYVDPVTGQTVTLTSQTQQPAAVALNPAPQSNNWEQQINYQQSQGLGGGQWVQGGSQWGGQQNPPQYGGYGAPPQQHHQQQW